MARTAPAPDIPPIPGMCPSIAVLAGGGDAGGGSGGSAGDGSGDDNAGASSGGENAEADSRGAPDYEKYPTCGFASHPVDVVTGRAFTHPISDLALPGPIPLDFRRMYSAKLAHRDVGLGYGWGHTFGWEIEVQRRRITVWNEQGVGVDFPVIRPGESVVGPWGWVLRRDAWGFAVDDDDGTWRIFSAAEDDGKRYRLTAIEDRNRNRISLTYEDGRLVEVVDSAGRIIRLRSNPQGRIAAIAVNNAISGGRWTVFASYEYDEAGNLVAVTDADGYTARYAYEDDHLLTADTDRTGLTFRFVYDREKRCIEAWGDYRGKVDPSLDDDLPKYLADGTTRAKGIHHCRFDYGSGGSSEVADSRRVRRYFGNRHGTLDKLVEGPGVYSFVYDDAGFQLAVTDPLGGRYTAERDPRGRIVKSTDPLGRTTTITRDAAGLATEIVDPAGGVTAVERDSHGNILGVTDATGAVTRYQRDGRGLLVGMVHPNGARTVFERDAHGNLVKLVQPSGAVFQYAYDAFGRMVQKTDPFGAVTRYTYSDRGDLTGVFEPSGAVTRYQYDGEGHIVAFTWPSGYTTRLEWGGYHKLCRTIDPAGGEVRYRYDREGQLVRIINEKGEQHLREYDPAGRLVAERSFDGRERRFRYDLCGRLVRATNALGEKVTLAYDLAGQLVERALADGATETFGYSLRGELVHAEGPTGVFTFERDAVGRIVRELQDVGGEAHEVISIFDGLGDRTERRTSLGHTEAVERDALGARVSTLLDGSERITHTPDALGREVMRALSRGGSIESVYDTAGRVATRRALLAPTARTPLGRGEPMWIGPERNLRGVEKAWTYDASSELAGELDSTLGSREFSYDPLGQVIAATAPRGRSEAFRYDPAGNVLDYGEGADKRAYGPGGRLLQKGGADYLWDDEGRLVEKHVREPGTGEIRKTLYRWDGAGLLRAVEEPDGTLVELTYDPFARRVQKRVSRNADGDRRVVELTRFVWDGDVLVHEIKKRARAGGDPVVEVRTYCHEDDSYVPLAHREAATADGEGAWVHYFNDANGAPDRLIGSDGTVVAELHRSTWGKTEIAEGARASTPIRYQGQLEDAETGLHYNRFRYYDPEAGRFISPDPLGLEGGLSPYKYGLNPLAWIDPLGLQGGIGPVLQGQAGVAQSIAAAQARGETVIGTEVTVVDPNGVRTRIDVVTRDQNGQIRFIEAKNGPNARLTKNQTKAFPAIAAGGCTPVGDRAAAAGLTPGTPLPPTTPQVDRW